MKELSSDKVELVSGGVAPVLVPLLTYYAGAAFKIGSTYYWASQQTK